MNKTLLKIYFRAAVIALFLLSIPVRIFAIPQSVYNEDSVSVADSDPLPFDSIAKGEIIDSVTEDYYEWDTISMSGKLSGDFLPISPSVKVYMERNRLVVISISAILMGEVARLEIDNERVIAVNMMRGKYSTMMMEEIEPMCPGGLQAIQNMLMGRITILGSGELSPEDTGKMEIYMAENGDLLLLPNQDLEAAPYVYYYLIDPDTLLLDDFVVMAGGSQAECSYQWGKKAEEKQLDFSALINGKEMGVTLRLNSPDSNPKKINRIELGSKYRAVSPKELMK